LVRKELSMAFDDYLSVLNSDLYDHKGIAKSLLSRIYMLVPRTSAFNEDGSDPTPVENEGFCTASQEYLARQLGVDPGTVSELVQKFYLDGWLRIEEYTDKFGHPRYKYEVTPETVERVKRRAMAKDANGEYVRMKCAAKVRKTSYRKRIDALLDSSEVKSISPHADPTQTQRRPPAAPSPSWHRAGELHGTVQGSSMARCGVPHGTVPDEGLKLSSSVSKRGILPDTATDKPTDKSNTQTLGSFAPEPRPGASRHPDPSVDVLASRPPVPPPPTHFSHRWITLEHTDRRTGKKELYDSCAFCVCNRTSPAAQKLCRPDTDIKEEAARWVESHIQSQGATV
jgi:hypothetical protein